LGDKDLLLKEKEWLLKEVHHRVKNNLQIMISLLNIQSANLKSELAQEAIRNSGRRMYAMSLIHQKLYQSEKMDRIDMGIYIAELAKYLKESFDVESKIQYELSTISLELDIAQAVPLGLILNEIITNSIKHAFPGAKHGKISVVLKEVPFDNYLLVIADNGVGLPKSFDLSESTSLGVRLIQGLTEQIQGEFNLENSSGTQISILFKKFEKIKEDQLSNLS
jgi:two-component sensor histidine kinase